MARSKRTEPDRAHLREEDGALTVTIVPSRPAGMIVFLSAWLCGWFAGEIFALRAMASSEIPWGSKLFMAVWLTGWTAGGIFAIRVWAWAAFGREELRLQQGRLIVRRTIGPFRWVRNFDCTQVRYLCYEPIPLPTVTRGRAASAHDSWADQGVIACGYGESTVRFGCNLDEGEAQRIVNALWRTVRRSR